MEAVFRCAICNRTEQALAQLYFELQQDPISKCKEKICSDCLKEKNRQDCKCGLKLSQHKNRYKHRAIENYKKEKKQRIVFDNKKFMPLILKQLHLEYLRNDRTREVIRTDIIISNYEKMHRDREDKHVMDINKMEKKLPNIIQESNGGDGKVPCGYKQNSGKGVQQILQAFYGFAPKFV